MFRALWLPLCGGEASRVCCALCRGLSLRLAQGYLLMAVAGASAAGLSTSAMAGLVSGEACLGLHFHNNYNDEGDNKDDDDFDYHNDDDDDDDHDYVLVQ
ncbi:hypothetical protein ElyMa_003746200 [Elysia marginata]|uniref:Uncharacterized protein n=1 Tax=Elysia marginata TaxID=1093978 RepID=A0AAV4F6S4_9GAST|nr:hypothetical protein ElyMa_003746200 [Elysia marginata]